jgi:arginyl-tRNA synthetase
VNPLGQLHGTVIEAAGALLEGDGASPLAAGLERPPQAAFGDYSTNAALLLSPRVRRPPRDVAERLGEELSGRLGDGLERVEVAGPGFLNLFLSDAWFERALGVVLAAGEDFGGGGATRPQRIDLEFVSANPTGPLTVAHGRHAAYGDALARILTFHGHEVTREFYVNDHGSQVRRLGESVRAWARGEPIPEDGYKGAYVAELVERERAATLDLDELCLEACAACLAMVRSTLETFGVSFDTWVSERSLHDRGLVDAARYFLVARSHDTTVDLDLALAVRHTNENPVYYVQYAHARICGVLAKAGEARLAQALGNPAAGGPLHPSERALLKRLLALGREVAEAAERRAPHRIAVYALDLAQDFTAFYRDCRIVGAEPVQTESFRLALAVTTQRTIARVLGLLGLSAPAEM